MTVFFLLIFYSSCLSSWHFIMAKVMIVTSAALNRCENEKTKIHIRSTSSYRRQNTDSHPSTSIMVKIAKQKTDIWKF